MKKYLFLLLIPILFFIPKNAYALDFNNAPYYCKYQQDGAVAYECGYAVKKQFPNAANNYGWAAPNTTYASFAYDSLGLSNYVRLEMSNQDFCTGSGENRGGEIDFYLWFDKPVAPYFKNSLFDLNRTSGTFTCTSDVVTNNYGLVFHCSTSRSFTGGIIGATLKRSLMPDEALVIQNNLEVGVGTWTADFECYTNESDSINQNNNINTDKIIDNDNKNQQQTNDRLDKIDDTLTSEEAPNLDSLNDSAGWLPAGPVDGILNLPLSLFQNLSDNLSKSCQPVIVDLPFVNQTISLPCISTLYAKMGAQDLFNWVGIVVGALILYNYFLQLYQWVDDTLTFRENNWQDWGGV